ncbi:MAG: tyrosine-type recombinase/integrase [Candidatus Acidiferrales bacterium]
MGDFVTYHWDLEQAENNPFYIRCGVITKGCLNRDTLPPMQRGHIFKHRNAWFLKYYDKRAAATGPKTIRVCVKLADVDANHRVRRDVIPLADKLLQPVNSGISVPESFMPVTDFIEQHYLPHVKATLRPSTHKDYNDVFRVHVKSRLGDVKLREFRTVHAQRMIQAIDSVGHTSKLRIKSFLSGVFTYAKQEGVLDGENPVRDVKVLGRSTKKKMPVYDVAEIDRAYWRLEEPAQTIWQVAALSGLRVSELRGLRWGDFDGENLHVNRSVWRTHINAPKTLESEAPVPVMPAIARVLAEHKERCKNPTPDSYIFAGDRRGGPLNMANLARRVIKPNIEQCIKCQKSRAKHAEANHDFVLNPDCTWKGWHALRRGLASNLYALGVPPKVIQSILRHSDVKLTMQYYVAADVEAARAGMKKLTDLFEPMG